MESHYEIRDPGAPKNPPRQAKDCSRRLSECHPPPPNGTQSHWSPVSCSAKHVTGAAVAGTHRGEQFGKGGGRLSHRLGPGKGSGACGVGFVPQVSTALLNAAPDVTGCVMHSHGAHGDMGTARISCPGVFLVCVLPYPGGGRVGRWVCQNFWVGGFPTAPPPPRGVGHCGGLWVSAEGAGQDILPVVRHLASGSWVGGCPIAPPPPCGVGTFVGLWVCQNSGRVAPSNHPPPPRGQEKP